MKRNNIISLILVFVFITAFIIFFKYDTGKKEKLLRQLAEEFPAVSIDQRLEGTVMNVYHPYPEIFNDDPLQAYILLNGSLKRRITTGHEFTKKVILDSILNVGDRLLKEPGSDILLVYKIENSDTIKFSFQLRDDLGYPLKKKD